MRSAPSIRNKMIRLIDKIASDQLDKCIVKPTAFTRVTLVQDAESPDCLFALLMVGDDRAVLVDAGNMNFASDHGGKLRLHGFRNELNKFDIGPRELRFCVPGAYARAVNDQRFDRAELVPPTMPDHVERFAAWRSDRADW